MLQVDEKFVQPFDVTDPFNDGIRLEGFLCRRPDHRYGAVAQFQALRDNLERRNKHVADDKLSGAEGAVWYVTEPSGRVTLWKCKPESVEEIHWAAGINKAAVIATCWNALETSDSLNYDVLLPLLLEEYQLDDIERFRAHIDDAVRFVNAQQAFNERVREVYQTVRAQGFRSRSTRRT